MDVPDIRDEPGDRISAADLYALLALRAEVFVIEQGCCYLDPDGEDLLATTRHLWVPGPAGPRSSVRVLQRPGSWKVGRVVTRATERGNGLAGALLDRVLATVGRPATMDAQAHLAGWYGSFGFRPSGPEFLEDDIPHLPLRLE